MRSLMLLRHAETEQTRPGSTDRARRLTPDGVSQVAGIGAYLRDRGVSFDLVLCSPATRTRQTAEGLGVDLGDLVVVDELYEAGGESVVGLIREVDDGVGRLLVVGHAPAVPWAVHELADPGSSDAEALASIEYRYPAGTLAQVELASSWSDPGPGRLVSVRFP